MVSSSSTPVLPTPYGRPETVVEKGPRSTDGLNGPTTTRHRNRRSKLPLHLDLRTEGTRIKSCEPLGRGWVGFQGGEDMGDYDGFL